MNEKTPKQLREEYFARIDEFSDLILSMLDVKIEGLTAGLMIINSDSNRRGKSKYLSGYSGEQIRCDEFPICAEARESFANFDKYCTGQNKCPHQVLTSGEILIW